MSAWGRNELEEFKLWLAEEELKLGIRITESPEPNFTACDVIRAHAMGVQL